MAEAPPTCEAKNVATPLRKECVPTSIPISIKVSLLVSQTFSSRLLNRDWEGSFLQSQSHYLDLFVLGSELEHYQIELFWRSPCEILRTKYIERMEHISGLIGFAKMRLGVHCLPSLSPLCVGNTIIIESSFQDLCSNIDDATDTDLAIRFQYNTFIRCCAGIQI